MNYKQLVDRGAKIIEPLEYYPMRPKVSGYMYGGKAVLELDSYRFHFDIWHHGPEPEDVTDEYMQKHAFPRGIQDMNDGKYYDMYWYCIVRENEYWLHPDGWFGSEKDDFEQQVENLRKNWNSKVAEALGFIQIL